MTSEPQPAPSAEPSVVSDTCTADQLSETGWYSCLWAGYRHVFWWKDGRLWASPDDYRPLFVDDRCADFRRLVLAAGVEELRRAASELLSLTRHIEVLGEWEALGNNARLRRETRVKVEAAEARLRAALAQLEPAPNQENAG